MKRGKWNELPGSKIWSEEGVEVGKSRIRCAQDCEEECMENIDLYILM